MDRHHDYRELEIEKLDNRQLLIFIAKKVLRMSDELDRLKTDVAALMQVVSDEATAIDTEINTLSDVNAKLASAASAPDDSTDLSSLSAQIETVIANIKTSTGNLNASVAPPSQPAADPGTGSDDTPSSGSSDDAPAA